MQDMSRDDNDETMTFRLPGKLRRDLERMAKRDGKKLSELVREVLAEAVGRDAPVSGGTRVVLEEIQALRRDLRLRRRRERSK